MDDTLSTPPSFEDQAAPTQPPHAEILSMALAKACL